ncbi:MAG: efflux RND transporter periplasmic adaptor subunit [Pseudomonadota bacterium]
MRAGPSLSRQLGILAIAAGVVALGWTFRERLPLVGAPASSLSDTSAGRSAGGSSGARRARGGRGGRGQRATPVLAAPIEVGRNDETITAVGTARALRSVTLFAKTEGTVVALQVRAGEAVRQGQMLLRLERAQADLALKVAESARANAEVKLKRTARLAKRRIAAAAALDDAKTTLRQAELAVDQARELIRDHQVVAPFQGVVGIPAVEIGDRVTPQTELFSLDDRSEILVSFDVPEVFLSAMTGGRTMTATTPALGDDTFSGVIRDVDSRIDTQSRTVSVRASFPNTGDRLRPGMSFVVSVKIEGDEFPSVPELALQWKGGESFVWAIRDGKAARVLVRAVKRKNARVLIEGDVQRDERVVIEGVQRLREGRAVFDAGASDEPRSSDDKLPTAEGGQARPAQTRG